MFPWCLIESPSNVQCKTFQVFEIPVKIIRNNLAPNIWQFPKLLMPSNNLSLKMPCDSPHFHETFAALKTSKPSHYSNSTFFDPIYADTLTSAPFRLFRLRGKKFCLDRQKCVRSDSPVFANVVGKERNPLYLASNIVMRKLGLASRIFPHNAKDMPIGAFESKKYNLSSSNCPMNPEIHLRPFLWKYTNIFTTS